MEKNVENDNGGHIVVIQGLCPQKGTLWKVFVIVSSVACLSV